MKRKAITTVAVLAILVSMLLVGFGGTQVAAEPGSMKGYWHFGTGIGSVAYDSSDAANDAVLSGGKFGNALSFDGTDDYVNIPDDDSLDITGELTIEAWVVADVITTYKSIIVKGDAYTEGKINYGLQIQSEVTPGTIRFFVWSPGYTWIDSTSQVPSDGNWHHVAVTHDNSNNVKIFIDGTLSGTGTLALGPVSNSPMDIGRHKHATVGTYQYWDGKIDEVRISNVVRYTSSFTPQTSEFTSDANTAGLWHFDESVDMTVGDGSANLNVGTIGGAAWAGPTWVSGMYGEALQFDGVDDYVNIPDNPSLDITGDITMEAWFKVNDFSTSEGQHLYIASKDSTSGRSYGIGIDITWQQPFKPFFIAFESGSSYNIVWGTTEIVTDTWYHIAGVYNTANSEMKMYIDATLESTITTTISSINSGPADLRIGGRQYTGHQCIFNGVIDEVRIWDNALNPCQVQLAMQGKIEILPNAGMIIYDTSFHDLNVGDTVTVGILPDDPDITIDYVEVHHCTPKKSTSTTTIQTDATCDYAIVITINSVSAKCKTAHLWLYLSNGEHLGVNLHFGH